MNKISTWKTKKEKLKRKIFFMELSNDSYYSSPLYQIHQSKLFEIKNKIEELKNEQIRKRRQNISQTDGNGH